MRPSRTVRSRNGVGMSFGVLLGWLLLMIFRAERTALAGGVEAAAAHVTNEAWEDWDYYQLLGFNSTTDLTRLETRDIKKAYKRQARRWHPDKHTSHSNKARLDEANRRFAKIAEAYQVLADAEKRQQYDYELRNPHRQQPHMYDDGHHNNPWAQNSQAYYPSQEEHSEGDGSFWSNFASKMDPRQMFQDLFDDDDDDDDDYHDFAAFGGGQRQQQPIHVSQKEQVLQDAWGNQIVRIVQTSQFREKRLKGLRVQIVAQDFVEEFDSYNHMWVERPVGEPFLVDEYIQKARNSVSVHEPLSMDSILEAGRYSARVVPGCHLIIAEHEHRNKGHQDKEPTIVWQSDTESLPHGYHCQLEFERGAFLLVVKDGDQGHVVWHSPVPNYDETLSSHLVGRLDADGVLAVYRLVPIRLEANGWWLGLGMGSDAVTHSARLWQKLVRHFLGFEEDGLKRSCIWSTSPFRCLRIGRFVNSGIRSVVYFGRRLFELLSHLAENW